jgi:hypothetical protein
MRHEATSEGRREGAELRGAVEEPVDSGLVIAAGCLEEGGLPSAPRRHSAGVLKPALEMRVLLILQSREGQAQTVAVDVPGHALHARLADVHEDAAHTTHFEQDVEYRSGSRSESSRSCRIWR